MLTLLNRPDIPVAGGAWKPLMRDLIIADNVHGEADWMARACRSRPLRRRTAPPSS
jgi:inosine-uridine nucleoside N-ribohydrolase